MKANDLLNLQPKTVRLRKSAGFLLGLFCSLCCTTQANGLINSNTSNNQEAYSDVEPKIVNGDETLEGSRTYQAMLLNNGRQYCGGTLLSDYWVLTAAHCLNNTSVSDWTVRLGSHTINSGTEYNVSRMIVHSNWSSNVESGWDIALLELSSPADSSFTRAKLPTQTIQDAIADVGDELTVSGWGRTSSNGSGSNVLREVDLPVLSTQDCQQQLSNSIDGKVICGGGPNGKSACYGDSGGPFVASQNGTVYSFGTVSWGNSCRGATAFTRTLSYIDWINDKTDNLGGVDPDPKPHASFEVSVDDKFVNFTDKSSDDVGVSSWSWNFGDGSTSTKQNPTHEYADYGTYEVTLTVTDGDGNEDSGSQSIRVSDKSEFELENGVAKNGLSGNKDDVVHYFIDVPANASNLVVEISANNGDADLYLKQGSEPSMNDYDCRPYNGGSNETCTVDSPVAGTYYVMIHAYSAYDNLTLTASYDGEPDEPNADFTPTVNGLTVEFKDKSTGAESWSWNFGDGKSSNSQNPSHTYSKAGTYSVELTVTDADGNSDTATQSVTVKSDTPDDNCSSAWSGSTWYSAGDVVSYNGNNYEAINSNYNTAPDSWMVSWYWEDLGSCSQ